MDEVRASESGGYFVQHAVATRNEDGGAIDADIGAKGDNASLQFDASDYRTGNEAVDEDRGTAGIDHVELSAVA